MKIKKIFLFSLFIGIFQCQFTDRLSFSENNKYRGFILFFFSNKYFNTLIRKNYNLELKNLTGHTQYIRCYTILKNGYLASGSADATIKIWNTNSGQLIVLSYDVLT